MKKVILWGWIFVSIALLSYSFTQVDLSLTLSQVSVWQVIQKFFQQIGYFNRPLSTEFFIGIFFLMFMLYGLTLNLIKNNILKREDLWKIIIFVAVILFFAYNAFSYDFFNYIFDAKIFTHYHKNPYEFRALDFPGEPMLSFMHWTHRTYPYGLFWLVLTVPLSFIGMGYFLFTFYLFKLLMVSSFLGSVFLIEKIAKKMDLNPATPLAAFALNPLVLTESLVSAHNDIIMMFFALLAIHTFIERKYIKSFIALVLSIAIKYATVLIIPAVIAKGIFKVSREVFFYILIGSMLVAVILATYRTNFQPWYLLFVIPFASFVSNKYFIMIPLFVISNAALLQYVPFLYTGNWNSPIPAILNWIMLGSVIVSIVLIIGYKLKQKY